MRETDIHCCAVLVILMITAATCHEPKNDLLSGEDFLSLLLGRNENNQPNYRVARKHITTDDTFLPLENLFPYPTTTTATFEEYKTEETTTTISTDLPDTTTLDTTSDMTVISVQVSSSVKQVKVTRRKHDRKLAEDDDSFTDSSNVHSIIAAPESPELFEPKSRMQRKQDDNAPYQTLIHHNNQGSISFSTVDLKADKKKGKLFSLFEGQPTYSEPSKFYSEPAKFYSEPSKVYGEPSKVYGEPSKVYGVPEKIYSEPAKFYSEPSKVYGEPSRVYSEPSKVYGEPAKVYSQPAWSTSTTTTTTTTTAKSPSTTTTPPSTTATVRTVFNGFDKIPYDKLNAPAAEDDASANKNGTEEDAKFGYVVEGRNYRKYRVEEKTSDGFIVGEYGVLSHNDGSLRGVRYTADSNINPRLIQDALLKFLSL